MERTEDFLSVVIPVFNEEENLPVLHQRLSEVARPEVAGSVEFIFVNDGSSDGSLEAIREISRRDPRVRYLDLSRNFGHQVAVSAGLDHASGDAVVIMDADLQDPPEVIPQLVATWRKGYEVVGARRRVRRGEAPIKRWTAHLFYRMLRRLTAIDIPLDMGDFRLIDRRVVVVLRRMPEPDKYLRGQVAWAGFRQTWIEYEREARLHGRTGYTYRKMIRFALDGVTAFSDTPLKIVSFFGILVSLIAFLVILYSLFSHYVLDEAVRGWTSLMVSILFIGGIQMIAIGIIGEYLSRINHGVRNRPLYVVRESNLEMHQDGS